MRVVGVPPVVAASTQQVGQVADVPDGQPERVHLGQPPLRLHARRDARAQRLEGVVDGLHPPPLAEVGGAPLHHLLHRRLAHGVVVVVMMVVVTTAAAVRVTREAEEGRGRRQGVEGWGEEVVVVV